MHEHWYTLLLSFASEMRHPLKMCHYVIVCLNAMIVYVLHKFVLKVIADNAIMHYSYDYTLWVPHRKGAHCMH